jgi:UDP:flavonoid glycosyltransferase YjiC (YdhE family)
MLAGWDQHLDGAALAEVQVPRLLHTRRVTKYLQAAASITEVLS